MKNAVKELTDTPRTGQYRKTRPEPVPDKAAEIISNTFFRKWFVFVRNPFMKIEHMGTFS